MGIIPVKWISTADAVGTFLSSDGKWVRLSDRIHSAPDIKSKAKQNMDAVSLRAAHYVRFHSYEKALLDPVFDAVRNGELRAFVLTREPSGQWLEHKLTNQYLSARELSVAIKTGQAGKLRLIHDDIRFSGSALYFECREWEAWLLGKMGNRGSRNEAQDEKISSSKNEPLRQAAARWFRKTYPRGSGVKMMKTLASECTEALGRSVSERTMRRALGRK